MANILHPKVLVGQEKDAVSEPNDPTLLARLELAAILLER